MRRKARRARPLHNDCIPSGPQGRAVAEAIEPRRLFAAGSLDPSFGVNGQLTVNQTAAAPITVVRDSFIQADSKIVIVGAAADAQAAGGGTDLAIGRLNADGSPDRSFGDDGVTVLHRSGNADYANAVTADASGRLIVAATFAQVDATGTTTQEQFAILRFQSDGSIDPSFGASGVVEPSFNASGAATRLSEAHAIVVQPDGAIVAAGAAEVDPAAATSKLAVVRVTPDGALDPSFGAGGEVVLNAAGADETALGLSQQPDGKLVIAGATTGSVAGQAGFIVARLNPSGTLDSSFASQGFAVTQFARPGTVSSAAAADAVVVRPNGKIYAGGVSVGVDRNGNTSYDFALMRFLGTGLPDRTFGRHGKTLTDTGGFASINKVAVQPDGRIVASGIYAANGAGR